MRGVLFGTKHSFDDWGLMLKNRPVISPPTPKTKYVDVPGADGALDLTKALTGYVQYNNRKITFEFVAMAGYAKWPAIYSDIMDAVHGQVVEIVFDDDPNYYYKGRVTVEDSNAENAAAETLTITAEVEPYKMSKTLDTTYSNLTVSTNRTVSVYCDSLMPTIPTFTLSAGMYGYVRFGGEMIDLPNGSSNPKIVFRKGYNSITFYGDGTVSISFRKGRF